MDFESRRIIIVSNRLPVSIWTDKQGNRQVKPSTGGLVTALAPIVRKSGGKWIGWSGAASPNTVDELLVRNRDAKDLDLIPVPVSAAEIARYYRGFSNKTIWPLFHDLLGQFSFDLNDWQSYQDVNRRFAETTASAIDRDGIVWIHDYQLLLVGHYLRELGVTDNLSFFLHIPFPSYDLFRRLPWNRDILQAMLAYDHIGFQTPMDRRNFIACVKWLIPDATRMSQGRQAKIRFEGRNTLAGYYPISIDFEEFTRWARSPEADDAAWYLRENLRADIVALGIDRLDYTKGIPHRFLAFERLLEKYPETQGKISLLQVVIPSRIKVPEYQDLKSELDSLVGRINARFSREGWVPIHYQYRYLDTVQLMGHYRAADLALITPLRDGMNLVAKEYCACNVDDDGILVLSEFAGAAQQLRKGALLVNPYDSESTADAIYAAYIMPPEERARRMRLLRAEVKRNDVRRWVHRFFEADAAGSRSARSEPEKISV